MTCREMIGQLTQDSSFIHCAFFMEMDQTGLHHVKHVDGKQQLLFHTGGL